MDLATQARYDARARIIKALAHPTRLFIVERLARSEEKCVCDLTEMIGSDMSTVSKHLAILKSAGIVADEKRGAQVYYRLGIKCVVGFLGCVESVLKHNALQQQRLCRSDKSDESDK